MLGWVWRLRHSRSDTETLQRGLEVIERNTRAQQRLIDDLLDLSRIARGQMHVELRPLDLHGVVTQVVESSRPAAEAKGLTMTLSLPDPGTCVVSGDASRLQQVLLNLVSNATKFTGPAGQIAVSLVTTGDAAALEVRDTGAGIPPDFLPHVFDQFRQLDSGPSRNFGGLGLGLAIVRHIVRLHGGRVEAESDGLGKGATLRVSLPLLAVTPDAPAAAPRGRRADDPGALSGVRVIAVDDEPDTRDLLGHLLRQWGADVRLAGSAREALELVAEDPPDVLVSDIGLPEEDGYALVRQLRALPPDAGGGIPAVALTAYATADDRTRALAAGFQLHLPKPIDPEALRVSVSRLARDVL
jgi:CheY-like chemotaxis protein